MDTSLSEKLQTPEAFWGIFLWCCEGYKMLECVGYFTKNDEVEGGGRVLQRNTESVDCVHLRVPNVTGKFAF